jgi:hypothetical protein
MGKYTTVIGRGGYCLLCSRPWLGTSTSVVVRNRKLERGKEMRRKSSPWEVEETSNEVMCSSEQRHGRPPVSPTPPPLLLLFLLRHSWTCPRRRRSPPLHLLFSSCWGASQPPRFVELGERGAPWSSCSSMPCCASPPCGSASPPAIRAPR